ncbi:hypothetical protein GUITHDRAFT_110888 [Guillardia theta CCMP2712]|uniref:Uncharacterized protein n=1 Tax=Guillardia theta (strain CCMP2712) TaxID=905079 RepID=L1J3R9_GUITC|nr:hypothetical protein GUITHDRAFT_110888 [Guillardia theta CCMP2712]EKX43161.1 hypothetical protein GUITHDRAFT_110888 [Guillardia theta CCMP2712]|eukprot:XP_005830141.1 hypothetical protein GUITHDRAFT_110888 [Guillardia theta CCMP2712]
MKAESELNEVLRQLEQDADVLNGRIRKRTIFFFLVLVASVMASPCFLISLREAGYVEVKKGTAFCRFLSGWDFCMQQTKFWTKTSFLWLYMKTACALSPKMVEAKPYEFNLYNPPLMKDGFFGKGQGFCVPDAEWQKCYSSWPCCKHKPNFCWEFIWNGGRKLADIEPFMFRQGSSRVVVDSCSLHGGCNVMIRRYRKWELISETSSIKYERDVVETKLIGVALEEVQAVNKTLNVNLDLRGWGLPSSTQYLLKLGPHSDPREWRVHQEDQVMSKHRAGRRYRTWQLVSRYSIVGTDMQGNAHEFVSWHQREWKSYQDVM